MRTNSYLMINLNDSRSERIAEVLSNKTSKKILEALSSKDMSESELSEELEIPLNTTGYNVRKLVEAGLIEKSKNYFWSKKGKKISVYRISNKKILISPKSMVKGIVPTVAIIGSISLIIHGLYLKAISSSYAIESNLRVASDSLGTEILDNGVASSGNIYDLLVAAPNSSVWFLIGGLAALLIIVLLNWSRKK